MSNRAPAQAVSENFTKVVNSFFDDLRYLSGGEAKAALVVFRETTGWQRQWAPISFKTFSERLGCEVRAAITTVQALERKGRIEVRRQPGKTAEYRLTYVENDTSAENNTSAVSGDNLCSFRQEPMSKTTHAYKEERKSSKKDLKKTSSSPPPEAESAAKRTRRVPPSEPATPKLETESRWWHRYERKSIQDRLNGVKGWGSILQFPTWADAEALLADNFESAEDFREWTESARLEDFREAKYWGFLKRSAEGWRSKRDGYREEREREQAKAREFEERQRAATARVVDITPKEAETPKPQAASTPQADPQPSRSAESSKEDIERKRARLNQQIASLRGKIATYPGYINAYVWEGQLKHLEAQLSDLDGGHYADALLDEQAGGEAPCTESAKPAAVAAATPMHSHRQPAATTRRRSGDHGFTQAGSILRAMAI